MYFRGTIVEVRREDWRLLQWVMKEKSGLDRGGNYGGGEGSSDSGGILEMNWTY